MSYYNPYFSYGPVPPQDSDYRGQTRPPPKPEGPLPHQSRVDHKPVAYTYEDEEPERIPIAPMSWNNNRSSVSKEELIDFFVKQGCDQNRAAAQVDREFSAYAAQHVAGEGYPRMPRAKEYVRDPPRSSTFGNTYSRTPSPEEYGTFTYTYYAFDDDSDGDYYWDYDSGYDHDHSRDRSHHRSSRHHRHRSSSSSGYSHESGAPKYGSAPWYSQPRDEESSSRSRSSWKEKESSRRHRSSSRHHSDGHRRPRSRSRRRY